MSYIYIWIELILIETSTQIKQLVIFLRLLSKLYIA